RRMLVRQRARDASAKPGEPAEHAQEPGDLEQQLENLRLTSKALQCLGGLGGVEGLRAHGLDGFAGHSSLAELAELAMGDARCARRTAHDAPSWCHGQWQPDLPPPRCHPQGGLGE
ncbi:unnamed protein product, partial [Prorocentrum cordatum]